MAILKATKDFIQPRCVTVMEPPVMSESTKFTDDSGAPKKQWLYKLLDPQTNEVHQFYASYGANISWQEHVGSTVIAQFTNNTWVINPASDPAAMATQASPTPAQGASTTRLTPTEYVAAYQWALLRALNMWRSLDGVTFSSNDLHASATTIFIELCKNGAVKQLRENIQAQPQVQDAVQQVISGLDGEHVVQQPAMQQPAMVGSASTEELPF
jgi:hypothetical protein